jgi:CrcB protein
MITRTLIVGAGGFIGAIARYAVGVWCDTLWRRDFPLATFAVNVSGCFILGLFLTLATERLPVDPRLRLFVATGFVGAYTTFSTFEYETQRLTSTGALGWAIVNVLTSVVAGYAAVQLGVFLARR